MTASGAVTLLVVRLSDSFSDFWPALARDLGVPLVEWTAAEPGPPPAGAGVVLVAAGGQEADVPTLLGRGSRITHAPTRPPPASLESRAAPPRSCLITAHTDSSRDTGSRRLVRGGAGCMMLVEVRDHAAGS